MTENLLKYIPKALRMGSDARPLDCHFEKESNAQILAEDVNKNQFLVDPIFSLHLDEIA